jgi:DNA-binding transcriptional LysR family regulator
VPTADPRLPGSELAAFAAAVESGTVRGAAETLNLTQSAATKRIRSLERRVGASLLDRGALGVAPTRLGRVLYPEAKHVLSALAAAERVIADEAAGDVPLRLAASRTIGEFVLPRWLAAFRMASGAIRVELDVRNSPAVLAALHRGEVDVAFVEGTDELDGLDVMTLVHDEIVVVVAAGHRWARRDAVDAAQLSSEPFLTREKGSGTRAVAEQALGRAGVILRPSLEAASTQSLKRAVRAGGFTLLSRLAVSHEDGGGLVRLRVRGADLSRELRAVRISGRPLPAPGRDFWAFLGSRAALH